MLIRKNYNSTQYNFSIVMAYHNRKKQIIYTLNNFEKEYLTKYSFEVIIIDDNSKDEEQLFDILNNYNFRIVYKFINAEEKGEFINPCIAYNKGFALSNGKIIIIQNPECIHFTDIMGTFQNMNFENSYYTIPVITSTSFHENDNVYNFIKNKINKTDIISYLENLNSTSQYAFSKGWYNHWFYRGNDMKDLHFCSAISKNNLDKLEGFDETYGKYLWYDDNEFKFRISQFLNIIQLQDELAIHLYHDNGTEFHNDRQHLIEVNKQKFYKLVHDNNKNQISWNINNEECFYSKTETETKTL